MSEVPQLDKQAVRSLVEVRAGKAAAKIHVAEKAEQIALRVKNAEALKNALIQKLEAQRDFASQYRQLFPPKVRADDRPLAHDVRTDLDNHDRPTADTSEGWVQSYGFAVRTVRRWCELLDETACAAKQQAIFTASMGARSSGRAVAGASVAGREEP